MKHVEASLNWESWEQYCVWKLINAQSVPIENYITILPKLETKSKSYYHHDRFVIITI